MNKLKTHQARVDPAIAGLRERDTAGMPVELASKRAQLLQTIDTTLHSIARAGRDLTDAEDRSISNMLAEVDRLDEEIARVVRMRQQFHGGGPHGGGGEWRDLAEWFTTLRTAPDDPRLERRELDSTAYQVPTQFVRDILRADPNSNVLWTRAQIIPAGDPPDGPVIVPRLDQTETKGFAGGIAMEWLSEGGDKPETTPAFDDVTLTPHEVAGHVVVTDRALRNLTALNPFLSRLLRDGLTAAVDRALLTGSGIGQPTGIIGHPSAFEVPRAGAGAIVYADIANMYARLLLGGPAVWIASQSVLPELLTMADESDRLIWQPSAREGAPGNLLGFPVLVSQHSPHLGDDGDLILADLRYYLIKEGSGPFVQASEHVFFRSNKTVIKVFWNVDGKPWPSGTFKLWDSQPTPASFDVSPFVVLGPAAG